MPYQTITMPYQTITTPSYGRHTPPGGRSMIASLEKTIETAANGPDVDKKQHILKKEETMMEMIFTQ